MKKGDIFIACNTKAFAPFKLPMLLHILLLQEKLYF